MFLNLLITSVAAIHFSPPPKPTPTWDVTCHIGALNLIPPRYTPPFRVKVDFQIDGMGFEGRIRRFQANMPWKNLERPFEKVWRSDLHPVADQTGIYVRSLVYTVFDSKGKKVMWFDGNSSPFSRSNKAFRGIVLSVKPTFSQDGQLRVSHDVEFE